MNAFSFRALVMVPALVLPTAASASAAHDRAVAQGNRITGFNQVSGRMLRLRDRSAVHDPLVIG
jgi:hypothetical protein